MQIVEEALQVTSNSPAAIRCGFTSPSSSSTSSSSSSLVDVCKVLYLDCTVEGAGKKREKRRRVGHTTTTYCSRMFMFVDELVDEWSSNTLVSVVSLPGQVIVWAWETWCASVWHHTCPHTPLTHISPHSPPPVRHARNSWRGWKSAACALPYTYGPTGALRLHCSRDRVSTVL